MSEEYSLDRHQLGLRRAVDVIRSEYAQTDYIENEDMQSAIKAYLDATGMVMVPREPTQDMHQAWHNGYDSGLRDARHENGLTPESMLFCFTKAHQEMIAAAPNPFQTPEESREKK